MATGKHKRKTAKKGTGSTAEKPVRSEVRPSRREDREREAAARRIYADEESILKADAADVGMDGTRKRTDVHKSDGTKRAKTKESAGPKPEGKVKNLKSGKSEAGRAESAKPRRMEKSGTSFENAESDTLKKSGTHPETSEEHKKSPADAKTGKKSPEKTKIKSEKSAKTNKNGKRSAGKKSKKNQKKPAGVPKSVNTPEKRAADTASNNTPGKRAGKSEKEMKPAKPAGVSGTGKKPAKRAGVLAAERKPLKMPSGEVLIREIRQAVHFDKKVFAGVLCAVTIASIILINITELGGIAHQPLTDISAGHDALANQMMKDLTVQTQSISAIEDAERAEREEAERAAMDAEAYEAQLAAEQAAYEAAHGDENDLFNTMKVRDPDELRMTLAENNAYAIGDSMIEGMNDGQYVNTENLIFRRGCGTYDSYDLFERAVNLQASVVWVQLGLNDMDMYFSDVGQFRDNYRKLILYLQENLPDCRIFLCNINPISPNACKRHPQYEYAGQYNQAIMELCEELDVSYVDNTTLVLNHPELWDSDGIHPVQDVYLWMLSHMCYEAGI